MDIDTSEPVSRTSTPPSSPTALSLKDEEMLSPSRALPSSTPSVIIALDNDEAIGSWGDLSLLYTVFVHVLRIPPSVKLFADLLTATGCARPGLRTLLDKIRDLKRSGAVSHLVMCTAAKDTVGWVSFLRDVVECWYGEKIYDMVIDGSKLLEWNQTHEVPVLPTGCAIYKDMNQVRALCESPTSPVFMIDDRPENIFNGTTHGVVPYTVAVNLVAVAQTFVPEYTPALHQRYAATLQETWTHFQHDPSRFTVAHRDKALSEATVALSTFVDMTVNKSRTPLKTAEESTVRSCRAASMGSIPEFVDSPRASAA